MVPPPLLANLISLAKIGPRVKFHFQLSLLSVLWSYWKKTTYAMNYKYRGLFQWRTENQAFTSLHLQADQFHKSFSTKVVSLNSYDLLLTVLVYMQHQYTVFIKHDTNTGLDKSRTPVLQYLLTYFNIKIFVRVHEAENVLYTFLYAQCFLGQLQYAYGFSNFSLILCL